MEFELTRLKYLHEENERQRQHEEVMEQLQQQATPRLVGDREGRRRWQREAPRPRRLGVRGPAPERRRAHLTFFAEASCPGSGDGLLTALELPS